MIEIEKNFSLKPGDKERLIRGAELVSSKTFTDVYYDDDKYSLTSRDFWLRKRGDRFELKVPLNTAGGRETTDRYKELETDAEIAAELGLAPDRDLAAEFGRAGYKPCATLTTKREHYRKGDFNLDFDEVSEMDYATFEAELMVNGPEEAARGEERVMEFAREYGLGAASHGKVIEYIRRNNPEQYAALGRSGVLREEDLPS